MNSYKELEDLFETASSSEQSRHYKTNDMVGNTIIGSSVRYLFSFALSVETQIVKWRGSVKHVNPVK